MKRQLLLQKLRRRKPTIVTDADKASFHAILIQSLKFAAFSAYREPKIHTLLYILSPVGNIVWQLIRVILFHWKVGLEFFANQVDRSNDSRTEVPFFEVVL